jgi:hypothetical protein
MSEILTAEQEAGMGVTLIFDGSDPPPPGTACAWCKGHFCPAKGYVGETAVCRECGEGKPCLRSLAVKKAHAPIDPAELAAVAPTRYERRCSECRGALNDLIMGPICSNCRQRLNSARKRAEGQAAKPAEERRKMPELLPLPCPYCGEVMGSRARRKHEPRCPAKRAGTVVSAANLALGKVG